VKRETTKFDVESCFPFSPDDAASQPVAGRIGGASLSGTGGKGPTGMLAASASAMALTGMLNRFTLGITGAAVGLARHAGGELRRGDYRRLTAARLCSCDEILKAEDAALLSCLDFDKKRLAIVRAAAERIAAARATAESAAPPMLAPYAA
jgi:hypothetical protein